MIGLIKQFMQPNMHIVYEFNGQNLIDQNGKLRVIDNLQTLSGAKHVITDFNNQAYARVIYLESKPKYAELLAKKKIQESGEFEDAINLLVHEKQKVFKTTKLYCTPVPASVMAKKINAIKKHEDSLLFSGLHDALWRHVVGLRIVKPQLFIVAHENHFDLLIASSKDVYLAARYTAFALEAGAIQSTWAMIENEIQSLHEKMPIRVSEASLFHSGAPSYVKKIISSVLSNQSMRLNIPLHSNSQHNLALLRPPSLFSNAIASLSQKIVFFFQTNARRVHAYLAMLAVLMFSLSAYAATITQNMQSRLAKQRAEINALRSPDINIPSALEDNMRFYETILTNAFNKDIYAVINDISRYSQDGIGVDYIAVTALNNTLQVEVRGYSHAVFNQAYTDYQALLVALQNNAYRIQSEAFETTIEQSRFTLQAELVGYEK